MKSKERGFGILAVIVIAAIIAIGGGTYYASTKTETNVRMDGDAMMAESKGMSLKDLLGKNVKCIFARESDAGAMNQTSGTVYVSGDDISGEFVSLTQAGSINSHMLRTNGMVYLWSDALKGKGVKMSVTEEMEAKAENHSINMDEKLDYECSDWSRDGSKFSVPTTIEFTDLTAMQAMMSATTSVSSTVNQCGACEMIPDASAKASCKKALSCK